MRQRQETKLKDLAGQLGWVGSIEEFEKHLRKFIPHIANLANQDVQDVMYRFYILNETQRLDEKKKPINKEERLFYTNLQIGRAALKTALSMAREDMDMLRKLRQKGMF